MKHYFFLFLTFLGLAACDDCSSVTENLQSVRVRFRSQTDGSFIDTTIASVEGVGSNQPLLFTEEERYSEIVLPLLTSEPETIFIINYDSLNADTLLFEYVVRAIPLPPDCGVDEEITELKVPIATLDSLVILHSTLLNVNEYDMEIYY